MRGYDRSESSRELMSFHRVFITVVLPVKCRAAKSREANAVLQTIGASPGTNWMTPAGRPASCLLGQTDHPYETAQDVHDDRAREDGERRRLPHADVAEHRGRADEVAGNGGEVERANSEHEAL